MPSRFVLDGSLDLQLQKELTVIQKTGLFGDFDATALVELKRRCPTKAGQTPSQAIRGVLLELLMEAEEQSSPDDPAESLKDSTNFGLELFQARTGQALLRIGDARKRASAFMEPVTFERTPDGGSVRRQRSADAVLKRGRGEHKLYLRLVEALKARPDVPSVEGPFSAPPAPDRHPKRSAGNVGADDLYIPDSANDLAEGFWWRASTRGTPEKPGYVHQLAALEDLSIVAAADGAADVGRPYHKDVLRTLLTEALSSLEPTVGTVSDETLGLLVANVPQAYLGSIVRTLYQPSRPGTYAARDSELKLARDIGGAAVEDRSAGGFVARGITLMAFAMRNAGRNVQVISAHYDDDLSAAAEPITQYYPELVGEVDYREYQGQWPRDEPGRVPLIRVHGRPGPGTQGIVVGEADFLADDPVGRESHPPAHVPRRVAIRAALTEGDVLIVGSSLDDSALVSMLAETKHLRRRRYALMLPPVELGARANIDPTVRQQLLRLLAYRYIAIGVAPIFVDFAPQVPQLLREVALCVARGEEAYRDYGQRLDVWWDTFARTFGYSADGQREGGGNWAVRKNWGAELGDLARSISRLVGADAQGEHIRAEVWIRNHKSRELFLLASSGATKVRAPVPVDDPDHSVAKAFRAGQTEATVVTTGRWKHYISTIAVLHGKKWHRLTVGVISIMSDKRGGKLASADPVMRKEIDVLATATVRSLFQY